MFIQTSTKPTTCVASIAGRGAGIPIAVAAVLHVAVPHFASVVFHLLLNLYFHSLLGDRRVRRRVGERTSRDVIFASDATLVIGVIRQ